MLDNIIATLKAALQHTSDIPVIMIFIGVLLFSFSFLRVRVWLYFSITIIAVTISILPGYYLGPAFTRFLINVHIISPEWNASEDISRSVGLGIIISLVVLLTTSIMITTTFIEVIKKKDPLYLLKSKKNPTIKDYLRVPCDLIDKKPMPDLDQIDLPARNLVYNNFNDEELQVLAFKWVSLGLPEHRAIKKVLLDLDVQKNAM
ncbi:hypothetical protein [Paenibacillus tepidiphilus]|uniref:hypothetical protein n=1 Tax=Paenibacillus tepidiphilus TaxID=2608683 RepID=UPI001238AC03|nr:hypothetical protein [Paenibacillus tepidiphilus]